MSTRVSVNPPLLAGFSLLLGGAASLLGGCFPHDDSPCGLTCQETGVLQGNASISGIASIDAFFGAVIDFTAATDRATANVQAELDGIALSVGLPAGSTGAEVRAGIEAKVSTASGGLEVKYASPACKTSLEVTASAAAECDAELDPGSVEVRCEGSCVIDASAQAQCEASGSLTCVGQAPHLECDGTCTGTCQLTTAATCEGTCRGDCSGTCTVRDAQDNCAGACDGDCQGECTLSAGGSCTGSCEGQCETTPQGGMCDASAQARCDAMVDADIQCKGGCEGDASPPRVSAECEASVDAKAKASVECTPPAVEIAWQWSDELQDDASAQAEFRAWVNTFRVQLGGLVATSAKAKILGELAVDLAAAADGAVKGGIQEIQGSGDLKALIGASCALASLADAIALIEWSGSKLSASTSASLEVFAALGG